MGLVCLCADNQREAVEKKLSSMNGVETLYIFLLDITIIRVFGVFVFCLLFCKFLDINLCFNAFASLGAFGCVNESSKEYK